jgi:hypothetical protein
MLKRGYCQSNADHTLFYKHNCDLVAILIVYVDDIVITGDDSKEIQNLKQYLSHEFEVKDMGFLRYFLGIEVTRGSKGIFYLKENMYLTCLERQVCMDHVLLLHLLNKTIGYVAMRGDQWTVNATKD